MTDLRWGNGLITLEFLLGDDRPVRLTAINTGGAGTRVVQPEPRQPLVEVLTAELGRAGIGGRATETTVGEALRYQRHTTSADERGQHLEIVQYDSASGLWTTSHFTATSGVPAVRTSTTVTADPGRSSRLWAVTSLATGAFLTPAILDLDVWEGRSSWSAEHHWSATPLLSPGLARIRAESPRPASRVRHQVTSFGIWSAGVRVPAGAVQDRVTGQTLAWQIDHNGPWQWEVGERPEADIAGGYLAVTGPTDEHHHWSVEVTAERPFTSVPVTFTVGASLDDAFGSLAVHRRATRRPHPQNQTLPVIFNDYMNTLNGDPTQERLLPLIDAAASVGAEYFCIDAGWYDDTAGWWASVGDWIPSTTRFPSGLGAVLDHIRSCGMVPGLWLEPEVVGVTSAAARELPDEAFLQRDGVRIREHSRYLLDLRSTEARHHLDAAVDRLVADLGVGYFKLDCNVTPGAGTDREADSVGDGLLQHSRAVLAWLNGVLDRHPQLILENCGSGAMRSDFAMLSVLQLQSTSDQQDPLLYPAIAVGALAHVLPEQAAHWAYPQPEMTDEMIIFTLCTGLAGRLYLSGFLDRMSPGQLALVAQAVAVHQQTKIDISQSIPRFPTGLPSWSQPWTTVAFVTDAVTYVIIWRQAHADARVELDLPGAASRVVEQLYPTAEVGSPWRLEVTEKGLRVDADEPIAAARMYAITDPHASGRSVGDRE